MKKIILIVLIAAGAWWYFVGRHRVSVKEIQAFYQSQDVAMHERNADALCDMFTEDFKTTGTVVVGRQVMDADNDKPGTCKGYRDMFKMWDIMGKASGRGQLPLEVSYTLNNIKFSSDHRTATVDIDASINFGGGIMKMHGRSNDTLVRKDGKILMLRSDGEGTISMGNL